MTPTRSVNEELWGVDGCAAGWIAAISRPGVDMLRLEVFDCWTDLADRAANSAAMVAVDMPVGLAENERRPCDVLARKQLGRERAASIFAPPRRPMLTFDNYRDANRWGKMQGPDSGGGLSKQAWNLVPKIREIDDWIDPKRQSWVREAHPELAFQALNGGICPPPKREAAGLSARLTLLTSSARIDLPPLARTGVKLDDIYDAAVLTWTAGRIVSGQAICFTAQPTEDARGLKMEIYC